MDDQVHNLNKKGISAVALTSALSDEQKKQVEHAILSGKYKFIYISPEKLSSQTFQKVLSQITVDLVVVDEAHCISEWGHQFRPAYTAIAEYLLVLSIRPIIAAFTASATPHTADDIVQQLNLNAPQRFRQSVQRPNLSLRVAPCPTHTVQFMVCMRLLKKHIKDSVIIYCATRQLTEEFAATLRQHGYGAEPYHAGLSAEERKQIQHRFLHDACKIICATTAFGMGVDKSNIRCVIHLNLPASLEGYYQEIGRAGRDGKESVCYLLSLPNDEKLQSEIVENGYPALRYSLSCITAFVQKKWKADRHYSLRQIVTELDEVTQRRLPEILKKGELHSWWKVSDDRQQIVLAANPLTLRKEWQRMTEQLLHQYEKLKVMCSFLSGKHCRVKRLLWYFEPKPERALWLHFRCGKCDICAPSTDELPSVGEVKNYRRFRRIKRILINTPPLYELCTQILGATDSVSAQQYFPGIGRGWREAIAPQLDRVFDQQNRVDDSTRASQLRR